MIQLYSEAEGCPGGQDRIEVEICFLDEANENGPKSIPDYSPFGLVPSLYRELLISCSVQARQGRGRYLTLS